MTDEPLRIDTPEQADQIRRAWAVSHGYRSDDVLVVIGTASRIVREFYVRDVGRFAV